MSIFSERHVKLSPALLIVPSGQFCKVPFAYLFSIKKSECNIGKRMHRDSHHVKKKSTTATTKTVGRVK